MKDVMLVRKQSARITDSNTLYYAQVDGLEEEFIASSYDFDAISSANVVVGRIIDILVSRQEVIDTLEEELQETQEELSAVYESRKTLISTIVNLKKKAKVQS